MRDITHLTQYIVPPVHAYRRISVWNRRLMIAAVVTILWAASMLALKAMGPDARALMAGEGLLLIQSDQ